MLAPSIRKRRSCYDPVPKHDDVHRRARSRDTKLTRTRTILRNRIVKVTTQLLDPNRPRRDVLRSIHGLTCHTSFGGWEGEKGVLEASIAIHTYPYLSWKMSCNEVSEQERIERMSSMSFDGTEGIRRLWCSRHRSIDLSLIPLDEDRERDGRIGKREEIHPFLFVLVILPRIRRSWVALPRVPSRFHRDGSWRRYSHRRVRNRSNNPIGNR